MSTHNDSLPSDVGTLLIVGSSVMSDMAFQRIGGRGYHVERAAGAREAVSRVSNTRFGRYVDGSAGVPAYRGAR